MRGALSISLATMVSAAILLPALLVGRAGAQEAAANKTRPTATAKSAAGGTMTSLKDKASYSIGNNIGAGLKKQGVDLNLELFMQGLREGLAGSESKLTKEEMEAVFEQFQKQVVDNQTKKNEQEGQAFLAANKKKQGVKVTDTGLQYKVIKAGKGKKPAKSDVIRAHYRGTFPDGTEFDSSLERGQPATFAVNQVIAGWTEALQQMPVGSKWQLAIPPDLAYGPEGYAPAIGPNATLVFEIELLGIEQPKTRLPAGSVPKLNDLPPAEEK